MELPKTRKVSQCAGKPTRGASRIKVWVCVGVYEHLRNVHPCVRDQNQPDKGRSGSQPSECVSSGDGFH